MRKEKTRKKTRMKRVKKAKRAKVSSPVTGYESYESSSDDSMCTDSVAGSKVDPPVDSKFGANMRDFISSYYAAFGGLSEEERSIWDARFSKHFERFEETFLNGGLETTGEDSFGGSGGFGGGLGDSSFSDEAFEAILRRNIVTKGTVDVGGEKIKHAILCRPIPGSDGWYSHWPNWVLTSAGPPPLLLPRSVELRVVMKEDLGEVGKPVWRTFYRYLDTDTYVCNDVFPYNMGAKRLTKFVPRDGKSFGCEYKAGGVTVGFRRNLVSTHYLGGQVLWENFPSQVRSEWYDQQKRHSSEWMDFAREGDIPLPDLRVDVIQEAVTAIMQIRHPIVVHESGRLFLANHVKSFKKKGPHLRLLPPHLEYFSKYGISRGFDHSKARVFREYPSFQARLGDDGEAALSLSKWKKGITTCPWEAFGSKFLVVNFENGAWAPLPCMDYLVEGRLRWPRVFRGEKEVEKLEELLNKELSSKPSIHRWNSLLVRYGKGNYQHPPMDELPTKLDIHKGLEERIVHLAMDQCKFYAVLLAHFGCFPLRMGEYSVPLVLVPYGHYGRTKDDAVELGKKFGGEAREVELRLCCAFTSLSILGKHGMFDDAWECWKENNGDVKNRETC